MNEIFYDEKLIRGLNDKEVNNIYTNIDMKDIDSNKIVYAGDIIKKIIEEKHTIAIFENYTIRNYSIDTYKIKINGENITAKNEGRYLFWKYKKRTFTAREENGKLYVLYSLRKSAKTLDSIIKMLSDKYIYETTNQIDFIHITNLYKKYQNSIVSMKNILTSETLFNSEDGCILSKDIEEIYKRKIRENIKIFTMLRNCICRFKYEKNKASKLPF